MDKVFVTTTAYAWLGKVIREDERFLHLSKASRVFNDGRFGEFVRTGRHANAEIEHCGPGVTVRIPHTAVVDIVSWEHALPDTDQ